MLINKIIRHFSQLKLSVDKFFNFAFSSDRNAAQFSKMGKTSKTD